MKILSQTKPGVFFLAVLQVLIASDLYGQEYEEVTTHEHESESEDSFHSISIMIGHTDRVVVRPGAVSGYRNDRRITDHG